MHNKVLKLLDSLDISYQNVEHEVVCTVQEAKQIDDALPTTPTKNLFLRDKKKNYFLITAYAYKELSIKDIAKKVGAKGGLSFAKPEDLLEILDVKPGSVTPFGLINAANSVKNVSFFLDEELNNVESIGIHPLRNDMTTIIKITDLKKVISNLQFDCNLLHF